MNKEVAKCDKGWHTGECCCNCANHYEDTHHCTTKKHNLDEGCVCGQHKGWICLIKIDGETRAHSGWSQHGFCELHTSE